MTDITRNLGAIAAALSVSNGVVQAVTPPAGDSSTALATTEFVSQNGGGFTTGDVKLTFKTQPDTGWVMMNDGTLGNSVSGATALADNSAENLFTLLWNNIADTYCPVVGGRGASAAADWAANKAITLPKALGRALAGAGSGSGLSARALGQTVGEETHTLSQDEMPSHSHTDSGHTHAASDSGHQHTVPFVSAGSIGGTGSAPIGGTTATSVAKANITVSSGSANIQSTGGGSAHNNMQPTTFLNVMIKL